MHVATHSSLQMPGKKLLLLLNMELTTACERRASENSCDSLRVLPQCNVRVAH